MTIDAKQVIDAYAKFPSVLATLAAMQAEVWRIEHSVRLQQLVEKAEKAGFTKNHPLVNEFADRAVEIGLNTKYLMPPKIPQFVLPEIDIPAPEIPKFDFSKIDFTQTFDVKIPELMKIIPISLDPPKIRIIPPEPPKP